MPGIGGLLFKSRNDARKKVVKTVAQLPNALCKPRQSFRKERKECASGLANRNGLSRYYHCYQ